MLYLFGLSFNKISLKHVNLTNIQKIRNQYPGTYFFTAQYINTSVDNLKIPLNSYYAQIEYL